MTYLVHLTAPSHADAVPNWLLCDAVELQREESRALVGTPDLCDPPVAVLRSLVATGSQHKIWLLALDGETPAGAPVGQFGFPTVAADDDSWPRTRVLGVADVVLPLQEALHTYTGEVSVASEDCGVRALLVAGVETVAGQAGRSVATFYTWHHAPAGDPSDLDAAAGGTVPHDPGAEALLQAGFALKMVERNSMLDLPVPEPVLQTCEERGAGAVDYDIEFLSTPIPAEDRPRLMHLFSRMDIESPHDGLDVEAAVWDDERFNNWEKRRFSELMTTVLAVARHRATRDLAGFSCLLLPLGEYETTFQGSTLVLPEQRGRGLGWALKAAVLRRVAVDHPERHVISTWNASNNPWMLAINEHLGFALRSVSGVWRKDY